MSGQFVHVSVRMVSNPLYGRPEFLGLPAAMRPFMRDPESSPQTYRCRQGQMRGKARAKVARRIRMATRIRDLWDGRDEKAGGRGTAFLHYWFAWDKRLKALESRARQLTRESHRG
mgnify:CR=1 FL=1